MRLNIPAWHVGARGGGAGEDPAGHKDDRSLTGMASKPSQLSKAPDAGMWAQHTTRGNSSLSRARPAAARERRRGSFSPAFIQRGGFIEQAKISDLFCASGLKMGASGNSRAF